MMFIPVLLRPRGFSSPFEAVITTSIANQQCKMWGGRGELVALCDIAGAEQVWLTKALQSQLAGPYYLPAHRCQSVACCDSNNVMEFSSNQEDIYNKLVNSSSKYGKETQVKYELTRPRKKQKKKNESRLEIVNEQFR